jgi:hypothetical protein
MELFYFGYHLENPLINSQPVMARISRLDIIRETKLIHPRYVRGIDEGTSTRAYPDRGPHDYPPSVWSIYFPKAKLLLASSDSLCPGR